jgi:hypothetical protein
MNPKQLGETTNHVDFMLQVVDERARAGQKRIFIIS